VRKRFTVIELAILLAIGGITLSIMQPAACRRTPSTASSSTSEPSAAADDSAAALKALAQRVAPANTEWKDGLAAVVLVDVSGSMADRVRDTNGERRRKIVIAQRAALDLVTSFEAYARAHPSETVAVGVYEFSQRDGEAAARVVIPPGPPDAAAARDKLATMKARGGTPIGDAMIEARRALDGTGLKRRHLLVVTDGENTDGVSPADVARVMEQQEDAVRAPLYFVAFDVDAKAFAAVKQHGGLVLPAKDGRELATTLDELLSDRIFVEAPRQ
jgi:Mg-chelatase subunit ChlD